MAGKPFTTLQAIVESYWKTKQEIKWRYEDFDFLLRLICTKAKIGDEFLLPNGTKLKFVDNFADDIVQFRAARITRYELKEIKEKR